MGFIAAYDHGDGSAEDRQLVRIARTWHTLLGKATLAHGIVDRLLDELYGHEGGCGWDALRRKLTAWALEGEWIEPHDPRLQPGFIAAQKAPRTPSKPSRARP